MMTLSLGALGRESWIQLSAPALINQVPLWDSGSSSIQWWKEENQRHRVAIKIDETVHAMCLAPCFQCLAHNGQWAIVIIIIIMNCNYLEARFLLICLCLSARLEIVSSLIPHWMRVCFASPSTSPATPSKLPLDSKVFGLLGAGPWRRVANL